MNYLFKTISPICLILFFSNLTAQNADTIFVDEFSNVTEKGKASHYFEKKDLKLKNNYWTWTQNKYYLTNTIEETCAIKLKRSKDYYYSKPERSGECRSYYMSGALKSVHNYIATNKNESTTEYHENGQLKSIGKKLNFENHYLHAFYDSTGKPLLDKGTGSFTVNIGSTTFHYKVKDSVILSIKYYHKEIKDTVYCVIDTPLLTIDGWKKFFNSIGNSNSLYNLTKKFRGNRLYIEFAIFENGKVGYIKKLNTISKDIDSTFVNNIKSAQSFTSPMLKNGKKVKVILKVPLLML